MDDCNISGFVCDLSLSAARADTRWCPAIEATCGVFDVIANENVDTGFYFYYVNDALLAIVTQTFGPPGCAAGPTTTPLPDCTRAAFTALLYARNQRGEPVTRANHFAGTSGRPVIMRSCGSSCL